jgi:multimeric flavodoxin WrbA
MFPMRITILNGEPDPASGFQEDVLKMAKRLTASGHQVTTLELRELDLKGCSGCFGCWVKTPGQCVRCDDSETVCRAAIGADLLLLASPITMGFTTALLKRAVDQLIPLLHPYFVAEGGEVHHHARYAKYPELGLILGVGQDSDDEDVEITTAMWRRMARNFKSRLLFTAIMNHASNHTPEEAANEIASAA